MAGSKEAQKAYELVRSLQNRFVDKLDALTDKYGEGRHFEEVTWLRDAGLHGGGSRFEARDAKLFNTASVNVSQVHYDDMPDKRLSSATAISTIIHPNNPHVPSIHIHISLTELREGKSYWRIMADLNPSIVNMDDRERFYEALQNLSGSYYEEGIEQGDKYFAIPALKQTRGVSHFYLENFKTEDDAADFAFAQTFGEGIIDAYIEIIDNALASRREISEADKAEQLAYHTLYLFQVLTLDRGTTAGLLVHNQNDVGIMGSLPSHINKELLASWIEKVQKPQDELVASLLDAIDDDGAIDIPTKEKLAAAVRKHYTQHPEALKMQASGDTVPTTIANHTKA
jgi:coproporphyrinogen III oxidase